MVYSASSLETIVPELQRLLYVDDDSDMLRVAEIALLMSGPLDVLSCNSGESAIAKVAAFNPQLVMLDLNMPGMNGKQTLRGLQNTHDMSHVAVVFITAANDANELQELRALGAFDIIEKPFDPMTLGRRTQTIWEAWQIATSNPSD